MTALLDVFRVNCNTGKGRGCGECTECLGVPQVSRRQANAILAYVEGLEAKVDSAVKSLADDAGEGEWTDERVRQLGFRMAMAGPPRKGSVGEAVQMFTAEVLRTRALLAERKDEG